MNLALLGLFGGFLYLVATRGHKVHEPDVTPQQYTDRSKKWVPRERFAPDWLKNGLTADWKEQHRNYLDNQRTSTGAIPRPCAPRGIE